MALALIAGQGGLPPHLVAALLGRGEEPLICEMAQFPSDIPPGLPRVRFRLETLGSLIETLLERGVTRLCMAGAVRRPPIDPDLIDAATVPLVARLGAALGKGDDGALRAIIALFEDRGITVVGAHEIAPDLLPPAGVLTQAPLPEGVEADVDAAHEALQEMGRKDLGQAVIVKDGQVVACEDDRGTDALLQDHIPTGSDPAPAAGGILFKAPKPGQDLRADMPMVGPQTARQVVEAGMKAMVLQAGGVMVMDLDDVRDVLDAAGAALWVRP